MAKRVRKLSIGMAATLRLVIPKDLGPFGRRNRARRLDPTDDYLALSSGWPSSQNQPPRYFTDGLVGSGTGVFASTAARNGSACPVLLWKR